MTFRRIYILIGIAAGLSGALLTTACSDDEGAGRPSRKVCLVLGTGSYSDMTVQTRALPTGFVPYGNLSPQVQPGNVQIKAFLTQSGATPADNVEGLFSYNGTDWSSRVSVDATTTYYVYGFMPASAATSSSISIAPLDPDGEGEQTADFAYGAVLSVSDLPAITGADPCVIVGVYDGGLTKTTTTLEGIDWTGAGGRWGRFDYTTENDNGDDDTEYVYLLLDHLYAALRFEYSVDATYDALRTIKVKQLALKPNNGSSSVLTVDITATLTANPDNSDGSNPLTVTTTTHDTGTTDDPTTIWSNASDPAVLTTTATAATTIMGCIAPTAVGNRQFVLTTTYDVYDKENNLVRSNQTAENVISFLETLNAGQMYTFAIHVSPTYLYQLSEPDLKFALRASEE